MEESKNVTVIHQYEATYKVTRVGRKWIMGLLFRENRRPILDKILINEISKNWRQGETHSIKALHCDTPNAYGHSVKIIPMEEVFDEKV